MNLHSFSFELGGLDGTNALGFLAAVGTLVVARAAEQPDARLRWRHCRTWVPVIDCLAAATPDELCERLAAALRGQSADETLQREHNALQKDLERVLTRIKEEEKRIGRRRLKGKERQRALDEHVRPLEEEARRKREAWLVSLARVVPRPELALGKRIDCTAREYSDHARRFLERAAQDAAAREAALFLAAFGSDACLERNKKGPHAGVIEATPFCFTRGSGNQYFLETAGKLMEKVDVDALRQTLFEAWTYRDPKLSMRWDPAEDKRYALLDVKPADEGAYTVWMANLLAYRSLALFPCAPTRSGLGTTAWSVVGGVPVFTWPIWEQGLCPDGVRTLLQLKELCDEAVDRRELEARGVSAVFRARRIRFPPTGASYKINFSPARAVFTVRRHGEEVTP